MDGVMSTGSVALDTAVNEKDLLVNDTKIEEIVSGIGIPPQPALVTEMRANEEDLGALVQVLKGDAAIAASVVKVANSPFYGLAQKTASIEHAASLLGTKTVINIATSQLLRASMSSDTPGMDGFWYSTEDVAKACAALTQELKVLPIDEAYTLGLFHNVGVALMLQKFGETYLTVLRASYQENQGSLFASEEQLFNCNHGQVGFFVSSSWNLPEYMGDIALLHHDLKGLQEGIGENSKVLYMLKMAEYFGNSHVVLGHQTQHYEWESIKSEALGVFGLSDFEYDDLEDLVRSKVAEIG